MSKKSYLTYLERKGKICVKEYDHDKKTSEWVHHDFSPKLFVPVPEETGITSIDDKNLKLLELGSIRKTREFVKELGEAAMDLYGFRKYDVQFICDHGYEDAVADMFNIVYHDIETEVHDGFPKPDVAKEPINMITLIPRRGKSYALTTCKVKSKEIEEEYKDLIDLTVEMFDSEAAMLRRFVVLFSEVMKIDIFIGWNSEKFDMPFIANRIRQVLGEEWMKRLSPFGEVYLRSFVDDFGEDVVTAEIEGVHHADMLHYYKKFVHDPQESYSLDNIANVELGVGKLHHESGIPGHLLYHEYPTDGLRYNIVDVIRLKQIDERKAVIDLAIIVANMSKSNIGDVIYSTRLWMNMIYDFLNKRNRYFQFRSERKPYRKIEGGFVACNTPGLHEYVASFDYASLYPSVMMGLNLGVETKDIKIPDITVDRLLNHGFTPPAHLSMGANGQTYRKDKVSFIVEMVDDGYKKRKEYKALKIRYQKEEVAAPDEAAKAIAKRLADLYDNYDKSIKTILNSLYGAIAEKNFQFYDPDVAESVTVTGQFMVRHLSEIFVKILEKNFGKSRWIIANDTDSAYINFSKAVEAKCQGMDEHERIEWLCNFTDTTMKKVVRKANDIACEILNAYDPARFDADREAVCRRAVFVKKKMYALLLSDMEGVRFKEPKMKIVGLSAKKSSTPRFFRDKMKKFFEIFLGGDVEGSIAYMSDIEAQFRETPIDDIANNASVSDLSSKTEYKDNSMFDEDADEEMGYARGTHINARASIIHNMLIEKDEKARLYIEPIANGDKVKMLPLKKPNVAFNENIIAWKGEFPKYFDDIGIRKYIDWNTHYQKAFRNPLDRIYAVCGINPNVSQELDVF